MRWRARRTGAHMATSERHLSGKTDKTAGKRKGRARTRPRFVRGKRGPDGKGP